MVSHWSSSDSKSPQSYQWNCWDSFYSSYFQVHQSLHQSLGDCTKSTNYNWYHRYFHVPLFFWLLSKIYLLTFLFTFFQFYSVVCQDSKVHNSESSLFLLSLTWSNCLAEIKGSVFISKSLRNLCISFSRTDSRLCSHHLFVWSNFNFLHNSQLITLPTKWCNG